MLLVSVLWAPSFVCWYVSGSRSGAHTGAHSGPIGDILEITDGPQNLALL